MTQSKRQSVRVWLKSWKTPHIQGTQVYMYHLFALTQRWMTWKLSQTLQPEGRVFVGSGGIDWAQGGRCRVVNRLLHCSGMCDGRGRKLCGSAHGNKTGSRLELRELDIYWFVIVIIIITIILCLCVCSVTQSCLTLCDLMDCSLPGSFVHGISQARIQEWVVIFTSRGSYHSSYLRPQLLWTLLQVPVRVTCSPTSGSLTLCLILYLLTSSWSASQTTFLGSLS